MQSRLFILSLIAASCLGAGLALAQTTPPAPATPATPAAPAATPAPAAAPAPTAPATAAPAPAVKPAPAPAPAAAQASEPSKTMTDVSKWTRKEWRAAKAKWVHEKTKWHDCNGQAKAQKLSGRKSWQFLYDCMTKS